MWMKRLPHLCNMAPCMSLCCVNQRYGLSIQWNTEDVLMRVVNHVATK